MSGVIVMLPEVAAGSDRDFDRYSAFIDAMGVVYPEDANTKEDRHSVPLELPKQDVGNTPEEIRLETGRLFAQGNFSHGAGQQKYHGPNVDKAKCWHLEGADISEEGKVTCLRDVDAATGLTAPRKSAIAGGFFFVADGTSIKRSTDLATWTTQNPHAGEAAVTVLDLIAVGDELFAALGVNGIHRSTDYGVTWTHYQVGGINLDIGTATKVRWLRGRLIPVGNGGRSIYEVAAGATPDALETLPVGWTFEEVFEAGSFIYGCGLNLTNVDSPRSRVTHYGLNAAVSGLEPKGGWDAPLDTIIRSGDGYLGKVWLSGGRKNDDGGFDPVSYLMEQDSSSGALALDIKIAQGEGAGALDLSVRAMRPYSESILLGWSLGAGSVLGAREGLAIISPARGAFSNHLALETAPATVEPILDINTYKGQVVFLTSDTLYFEDTAHFKLTAEVITSLSDFQTADSKVHDRASVACKPLEAGESIELWYTTQHLEDNVWVKHPDTISGAGAVGRDFALGNVDSRYLAFKIVLKAKADGTTAPSLVSVSARARVKSSTPEYTFSRTIELQSQIRKQGASEPVFFHPRGDMETLDSYLHSYRTLYEPEQTWTVWVDNIHIEQIAEPDYDSTLADEGDQEAYLVRMDFIGSRAA